MEERDRDEAARDRRADAEEPSPPAESTPADAAGGHEFQTPAAEGAPAAASHEHQAAGTPPYEHAGVGGSDETGSWFHHHHHLHHPLPPYPGGHATASPNGRGRRVVALALAAVLLLGSGLGLGWALGRAGHDEDQTLGHGRPPRIGAPFFPGPGIFPGDPGGGFPFDPGQPFPGPNGGTAQEVPGIDLQAVTEEVSPAVVDITTTIGFGDVTEGHAAGTGMILTSDGEVLTNNHVIRGATSIEVSIEGRPGTFRADVVGASPPADVALLQIRDVSGLPTIDAGDPSALRVDQPVAAIGNAFGRGGAPTATAGTVSALEQTITAGDPQAGAERLSGLIQSTAPIARGDSGGALANADGQVVGMITAASRSVGFGGTSTQGYAIAIDDAMAVVGKIRSGQETADVIIGLPGLLGVLAQDLDAASADRLGVDVDTGALITRVAPSTPAADAGITAGSVITRVDGQAVRDAEDLGTILHQDEPGQRVRVTWVTGSATHSATVTLITGPAV